MRAWFIKRHQSAKDSAPEGPFDDQTVIDGLKSARFTMLDFAYSTEEQIWRGFAGIELFRNAVRAPELGQDSGEWTALRQGLANGVVDGPFSTETVLRLLAAGELSFSDRVCHESETQWSRIGDRKEFDRGLSRISRPSGPIEDELTLLKRIDSYSGEELLRNVLQLRPSHPVPPLAQEILIDNRIFQPPVANDSTTMEETDGLDLVALEESVRGFYGKIPGSSLLLILSFSLFAMSVKAQDPVKLDIVPLKLATPNEAVLVFQTDSPSNEPIQFKLSAKSGEILDKNGYSQTFEVKREPMALASFPLGPLHLPDGRYTAQVRLGTMKKETSIFIGSEDSRFAPRLLEHQKQISSRQQEEKKTLYYLSAEFEKLAKELRISYKRLRQSPTQWRMFLTAWQRKTKATERQIFRDLDSDLAYPEEMAQLKTNVDKLGEEATTLDSAVQQKRNIASEPTSNLSREFANLRKIAGHLTSQGSAVGH